MQSYKALAASAKGAGKREAATLRGNVMRALLNLPLAAKHCDWPWQRRSKPRAAAARPPQTPSYSAAAAAPQAARTSRRELKAFYPAGGKGELPGCRGTRSSWVLSAYPTPHGCWLFTSRLPPCSHPAGSWSSGHPTPFVAIHAAVMKNGELVLWTVRSGAGSAEQKMPAVAAASAAQPVGIPDPAAAALAAPPHSGCRPSYRASDPPLVEQLSFL